MEHMFHGCNGLSSLDISNFDLENVVNMSSMFKGCTNLTNIIFKDDTLTKSLEDMSYMFFGCEKLHTINTKIVLY